MHKIVKHALALKTLSIENSLHFPEFRRHEDIPNTNICFCMSPINFDCMLFPVPHLNYFPSFLQVISLLFLHISLLISISPITNHLLCSHLEHYALSCYLQQGKRLWIQRISAKDQRRKMWRMQAPACWPWRRHLVCSNHLIVCPNHLVIYKFITRQQDYCKV